MSSQNAAELEIIQVLHEEIEDDILGTQWETVTPIGFEFEVIRVKTDFGQDDWMVRASLAGCFVWQRKWQGAYSPESILRSGIILFAQELGEATGWRGAPIIGP
ncbi:hypothetical protein MUO65_01245 [bacterium]|nr:hypothetical protein [bacterium]